MDVDSNFSQVAPPVFDGENYHLCAVKMESYLEEDYEILPLSK